MARGLQHRACRRDPARVFAPHELLAFVGPRRFAPGTDTEYTNTSFLLLGLIAQSTTGRSIEELYHQRLWEPLGLTAIFLPGFEHAPSAVAMAYSGATEISPLDRMSLISIGHSAFGLFSNARTVARWGHALFRGNVISVEMQSAMRTLVPAAGNIPGESGSGLGIRAYQYLDRTQFGHSGGATTGSSLLLHDPETGVDHFVLAPKLLDLATRQ